MGFKWSDYKEEKPSKSEGFDWSEFPEEKSESLLEKSKRYVDYPLDRSHENMTGMGAAQGGMIGALEGGPLGAIIGAGIGGYTGKAGENFLNNVEGSSEAPKVGTDYLTQPAEAGIESAAGELIGHGVGKGISKAIPAIWDGAKWAGKKALTTLGPTEEAITARLAGNAQNTANGYPELAESLGKDLAFLQKEIKDGHENAFKKLSNKLNISRAKITQPIYKAIHDLQIDGKVFGREDKKILEVLNELGSDATKFDHNVSEKQIFKIIRKIDDNINWDDQKKQILNKTLKEIRQTIDLDLKLKNPAYKEAIKPVHSRMNLLESLQKRFNFRQVPGSGLQTTDATASNIQNSLRENKNVTRRSLEALERYTGNNYQDLAQDYQYSKQFKHSGGERSSARTNLGGALGATTGMVLSGPLGGIAGGAAGGFVGKLADRYGGEWAAGLIDTYLKTGNSKIFGKLAPLVEEAAKLGPQALQQVGAVLGTNPEIIDLYTGISGIPTVKKIDELSDRTNPEVLELLKRNLVRRAQIDSQNPGPVKISKQDYQQTLIDIDGAKNMNTIEKAKSIDSLNRYSQVNSSFLNKVIIDGGEEVPQTHQIHFDKTSDSDQPSAKLEDVTRQIQSRRK